MILFNFFLSENFENPMSADGYINRSDTYTYKSLQFELVFVHQLYLKSFASVSTLCFADGFLFNYVCIYELITKVMRKFRIFARQ